MDHVTSADGTRIAFERVGAGPPIVVVGGAFCDRAAMLPTAEALAGRCSAIAYDRRGRGDSGDTAPYAVDREVEDLGALVAAAGGIASVYGHSSGAAVALHAAAHGVPIDRLVLHEPPFSAGSEAEARSSREFAARLGAVLAEGRHEAAVELFLTTAGMPPETLAGMRADPWWARAVALAPTLAYDVAAIDEAAGGGVPVERAGKVSVPTLVLAGGASPAWMIDAARQLTDALPDARLELLEGAGHDVPPELLEAVLAEFLA